jgi:hypothetical protein
MGAKPMAFQFLKAMNTSWPFFVRPVGRAHREVL